jgi:4-amino-4-deoxy-L-arabinose transferase-like glycosyltransferase
MPDKNSTFRRDDYLIGAAIFCAGLLIHLFRLRYWSPLPDEINYARCARFLIENRTLFSNDIMFLPPLFVYLAAILQHAGIELLLSVRLISAVAGALILPLLFLSARTYLPNAAALRATLIILPLFSFHLYSRLGQVEMLMLFFIILTLFLLLLAFHQQNPFFALAAGWTLGLGVWTKETTIGAIFSIFIFLLFSSGKKIRFLSQFLLGLTPPFLLLLLFSHYCGQNLLLEIMSSRGYDINMLQLDPLANLIALGTNLGYNLIPRLYYPWELIIFLLLAPVLGIFLLGSVIIAALKKDIISRFAFAYLTIHLPFFFLFSRKFDYYLLPAGLFLAFAGSLFIFSPLAAPKLKRIGTILIISCAIFNIYADRFLFFNRGTHATMAISVTALPPKTTLATSHPTLVEYLSARAGLNLKVLPLFQNNSYQLNPVVWTDTITTILIKYYYYERLNKRFPADWAKLATTFPTKKEIIDPDWSVFWTYRTGQISFPLFKKIADFARPTGIVILQKNARLTPTD